MSSGIKEHEFPYKIRQLDAETNQRIAAAFEGQPNGLVVVNHWGFKVCATSSAEDLHAVYNYPLDPRDVWLISPPKNGNTWSQEMIWLLANDLDYQGAQKPLMPDRWNFLDWPLVNDNQWMGEFMGQVAAESPELMAGGPLSGNPHRPSPKFIKSHLPLTLNNPDLLNTCKTFFVARNPKDACLSFFKHCRLMKNQGYVKDLPTFMQMYMDGEIFETPVVPMIIEAWNMRQHPNLCLVFYEDLQRDLSGQLRRMAAFLGKSYTDGEIEKLAEHLHIDNFRKNPYVNMEGGLAKAIQNEGEGSFIRKGVVGDWFNHCTPEMDAKFDAWLEEQLKGTDLKFVTKL